MKQRRLEEICTELLIEIGEDPTRESLKDTPARWARWWMEFIGYDDGNTDTSFESHSLDQMVALTGIRVWSLCEHHLLPFWCDVSIGYLAGERILGISKLARLAHKRAHGLQVQERLVNQIADDMVEAIGQDDVAVVARGQHLCMTMRGIKSPGLMISSEMRGRFRHNADLRREFLSLEG